MECIVAEPARLLEKESYQHLDPDPHPTNPQARKTRNTRATRNWTG
jgi:hypothetical protein